MAVLALSLSAWLCALVLMGGMDEGPGTPLHNLPVFLAGWVVMLTAMMLPSELNYIAAFAAVLRSRDRASAARPSVMTSFVAGYGIAWVAYGLGAYLLDLAIRAVSPEMIAWNRAGPSLAGSVLIIAGLFQVSSLKQVCLTGCRRNEPDLDGVADAVHVRRKSPAEGPEAGNSDCFLLVRHGDLDRRVPRDGASSQGSHDVRQHLSWAMTKWRKIAEIC